MSHQIELLPELKQLIDDFVSVRHRFAELANAYVVQHTLLQEKQSELEIAKKQITAMKQKQTEDEGIVRSYNQLKIDYDLLHSATANHREEIHTENKKRVCDLEAELKQARAKSAEQAEWHQSSVTQIVAEYEAKLRDADEKIRQLNRLNSNISASKVYDNHVDKILPYVPIKRTTAPRGGKQRWSKLDVEITPKAPVASRGRGRSRGGLSKRKLFKTDNEAPIDVE